MGSQESVQASGRVVCEGGVLVWDGKSMRQVVEVKKDVTYTNHDMSTLTTMMTRDICSTVDQFNTALDCLQEMSLRSATQAGRSIEYK